LRKALQPVSPIPYFPVILSNTPVPTVMLVDFCAVIFLTSVLLLMVGYLIKPVGTNTSVYSYGRVLQLPFITNGARLAGTRHRVQHHIWLAVSAIVNFNINRTIDASCH